MKKDMGRSMKAVQFSQYGPPSVLVVNSVPVKFPGPNEIRVRVKGSSLNHVDVLLRTGKIRLLNKVTFPKGVGLDFAGIVESCGKNISEFSPGSPVWGRLGKLLPSATGTAAEFVIVPRACLAAAPTSITLVEAASIPVAGLTALQAIKALQLKAAETLLIVGANGSVGSMSLQLAVARGAKITAICNSETLDFCKSLGASDVLDYKDIELHHLQNTFDCVIDCAGEHINDYRKALRRGGRFTTVTPMGFLNIPQSLLTSGPFIRPAILSMRNDDLVNLGKLVDNGTVRPTIDKVFALNDAAAAYEKLQRGGVRGKLVLTVP